MASRPGQDERESTRGKQEHDAQNSQLQFERLLATLFAPVTTAASGQFLPRMIFQVLDGECKLGIESRNSSLGGVIVHEAVRSESYVETAAAAALSRLTIGDPT
jgi:hypothetical protein